MNYTSLRAGLAPLAGIAALTLSSSVLAGPCLVVEDGTMPTDSSTYGGGVIATTQDISALLMETDGDKLTTTIELATPPAHPSASYITYWTDSRGGQFYTEAYLAADGTQIAGMVKAAGIDVVGALATGFEGEGTKLQGLTFDQQPQVINLNRVEHGSIMGLGRGCLWMLNELDNCS